MEGHINNNKKTFHAVRCKKKKKIIMYLIKELLIPIFIGSFDVGLLKVKEPIVLDQHYQT